MTDPEGLIVLDVSQYQGPIDWSAVAASGVVGAYLRVAEGVTPDTMFESHRKGVEAAGLLVGAYQFCRARHTGKELADVFNRIAGDGLTLPNVLDVEVNDGEGRNMLQQCICDWFAEMPLESMTYTYAPFWDSWVDVPIPTDRLWLAAYVNHEPVLPRAWSAWTLWQFTDRRVTPGVKAPCDASVFRGSLDELRGLVG